MNPDPHKSSVEWSPSCWQVECTRVILIPTEEMSHYISKSFRKIHCVFRVWSVLQWLASGTCRTYFVFRNYFYRSCALPYQQNCVRACYNKAPIAYSCQSDTVLFYWWTTYKKKLDAIPLTELIPLWVRIPVHRAKGRLRYDPRLPASSWRK
jgi:hypothetical protein